MGLWDPLWQEIFEIGQQLFFLIWPLKWNMTPQSNIFFIKKITAWIFFSQLTFKELRFFQIFFLQFEKKPWGRSGAYGSKFHIDIFLLLCKVKKFSWSFLNQKYLCLFNFAVHLGYKWRKKILSTSAQRGTNGPKRPHWLILCFTLYSQDTS